ncbi:peptidase family M49 [Dictyocaulus viviparus]|uniref:Peptidase family M49 n=1 Tax=Dictyocaulus viviparus TaxID=29172 RepID=A0A0D8Y3A2_DICVI|nr:peptidase family M49 [Dictyocaulus viviparus]
MSRICNSLKLASESAANDTQKKMISKYIEHFTEGDIKFHKGTTASNQNVFAQVLKENKAQEGSRLWIKDVEPVIESYIGFIENYRDPAGTRSEFEGWYSLIHICSNFDRRYDDIRQNEGFKNVSLGNVIAATPKQKMNFISQEDEVWFVSIIRFYYIAVFIKDLLHQYHKDSFEVQVGLHELLGHGSGKLFQKSRDGTFNFDKNTKDLITGQPVECRAEAVGYVLCCDADILEIFGFKGEVAEKVKYVNWLNEIRAGLLALEFYSPEAKKWGQVCIMQSNDYY